MIPSRIGSRSILRAALMTMVLAGVAACTGPNTASPMPELSSPIEGIIVAIDATSLTDVRGFTLRTRDATLLEFKLGQLENPTEFPPGHLAEHQATSSPVRAYFRVENGDLVVYRLEDAEASPAPSA